MWRRRSIGASDGKSWLKPLMCSLDWIFVFIVTYSSLSILFSSVFPADLNLCFHQQHLA